MVLATEKTPREDANAEDEAACGRHTSQTVEDVLFASREEKIM